MNVLEVCEENIEKINDFVSLLKNNYMTIHINYKEKQNYLKVYKEDLERISEIANRRKIKIKHL